RAVRSDLRSLAHDGDIDVADRAASCANQVGGVAKKAMRRRAQPLWVARREMHADITGADATEDRVGQGMKPGIGVGMADQAAVVENFDAAEEQMIARAEYVHVETLSGADITESRGEAALGLAQIVFGGHFEIRLATVDQTDRKAGAFRHRRVVGQVETP